MKILLDTHVMLWWVNEYEKLSPTARAALLDPRHTLYLSVASLWEIAIKTSLGKLSELDGGVRYLFHKVDVLPITVLPISMPYIEAVELLPFIHRDPFDRMIIATAKIDGLSILTTDENIHRYDVPSIW
ncbi:MAG: type II toxin-antitoxin system VapC family toxin [Defluviitaleaceae bacterium]|nr:type II toxin-antitoxin system VapC family toxin [Defluviitaleaceae bacterium]